MKRTASAKWSGDFKQGVGTLSTQSGVLNDTPYTFASRFENEPETNPEELIAAAHAGCFTMALSASLTQAGLTAEELSTEATLSFEKVNEDWTTTGIHLELSAKAPGVDLQQFMALAQGAKEKCPVSRLLKATITLDVTLEN